MNILKIVTYFNWLVIAVLVYVVAMETIFPAKGGDAAGRGIGQAIYYLAIFALVLLTVLNLLPYKWGKYAAFWVVAVPFLYFQIQPIYSKLKRNVRNMIQETRPIFEDPERDALARAIRDGKPEKLKELLQVPVARLNENGEILGYAVGEAASSSYRPAEKLECVRVLFQSGVKLDSTRGWEVPVHMSVADVGNAALLRLLLEQGANANATQVHFKRSILFEAIGSYQEPEASVRVLLEFGADPNAKALFDEEEGRVSPLWRAAKLERWGVCLVLLEKGADPGFTTKNGETLSTLIAGVDRSFPEEGYSRQTDFERLKTLLKH